MQESEKDKKLSQLFQVKRCEVPSTVFWSAFDDGLQRKLQVRAQESHFSCWEMLLVLWRRYKAVLSSATYGACCLVFLLAFLSHFHLERNSNSTQFARSSATGAMTQKPSLGDATVALRHRRDADSCYICDRMYTSGLNFSSRELTF